MTGEGKAGQGTVPGTDVPVSEPPPVLAAPSVAVPPPPAVVSPTPPVPPFAPLLDRKPVELEAPAAAPLLPVPDLLLLEDDLPAGAAAEGGWLWDDSNFSSGARSHGHPSGKGFQSHGYSPEKQIPITAGGMITQEVWLDPADPPKGIALQLRLSSGDEVGVYWEGEEEVFKPQEGQELWYYGPLPELGRWARLEILAEDMGLEDSQVAGLRFVTHDGRVLWDRTALTAAPPIEEAQGALETPAGARPSFGAVNGD